MDHSRVELARAIQRMSGEPSASATAIICRVTASTATRSPIENSAPPRKTRAITRCAGSPWASASRTASVFRSTSSGTRCPSTEE